MIRWIIGTSLKFRFLVIAGAAALTVFGATKVGSMPVDVFPEFAPPFIEIQTEGLGMSTEEAESLITIPLEQALASTPQLDVLRSKTVPGLSAITLVLKPGADSLRARQYVNERLAVVLPNLPQSAAPPTILQPKSATSRVLKIGMTSKKYSLTDLTMVAYWNMRPRLMAVPGVANVVIWGERQKQLQVQVDPQALVAHHISLDQAIAATTDALDFGLLKYQRAAKARVGGFIETPNQRLEIEHLLPVVGPRQLASVAVGEQRKTGGTPSRLGDLGTVRWGTWPLFGDAVVNDHPGLLLVVEKFPWGNTREITRGVERALDQMRPGLSGVQLDSTIFRPATFIDLSIDNLIRAMLIGTLLVVLILGAFLLEWRAALVSVIAIPLSLMAAVLVLYLRGSTLNTMVLAGLVIAVGVVVDDAIIDVENILRRLRQHRRAGSDRSAASIILDASLEVRRAIVYATLIIVLAVMRCSSSPACPARSSGRSCSPTGWRCSPRCSLR